MKLNTLMVCVGEIDEFPIYGADVGRLARKLKADLVLFHSTVPGWQDYQPLVKVENPQLQQMQDLADHEMLKGVKVTVDSPTGTFGLLDAITEGAERNGVDAIIMPTHAHRGVARWVLGSVSEMVIRSCTLPVLTLDMNRLSEDEVSPAFDRLVVPVDFSEMSKSVVNEAVDLSKIFGVGMTLVHAVEPQAFTGPPYEMAFATDYFKEFLDAAERGVGDLAEIARKAGASDVVGKVEQGSVLSAIQEVTAELKEPLVVMATAGRDSLGDHILGSRTERVMRHLDGSVFAIPARQLTK